MNRLSLLAALALGACLCFAGCGDHSRSSSASGSVAPASSGVVAQLTGDPDDEVDPALQAQVAAALQRGETDDPLDF